MKTTDADTMVIDEPGATATKTAVKPADETRARKTTPAKEAKIYIDGKCYSEANGNTSVVVHGMLYGDGIFEGIRSYNPRAFRLEKHIDRL